MLVLLITVTEAQLDRYKLETARNAEAAVATRSSSMVNDDITVHIMVVEASRQEKQPAAATAAVTLRHLSRVPTAQVNSLKEAGCNGTVGAQSFLKLLRRVGDRHTDSRHGSRQSMTTSKFVPMQCCRCL